MTENISTEELAQRLGVADMVYLGSPISDPPKAVQDAVLGVMNARPDEQPPIMDEDTFMDTYEPRDNPEGSLLWERDEVLVLHDAGEITDNHVWTAVDTDDGSAYVAGWHAVNQYAYLVTKVPWADGRETCEMSDESEEWGD
jgi:hypothetical protein